MSDSGKDTPIPPLRGLEGGVQVPRPSQAPGDVPVRQKAPYSGPGDLLRTGMRVRLAPDGPICTVVRVNECAAYVRRPFTKTIKTPDGDTRTFTAHTQVEAISNRAYVFPVEEEEEA